MRVGIFTDSYPPRINGVATSAAILKKALEELGHEVYVVTVGNDNKTYSYDEKEKVYYIPGFKYGIYDFRAAPVYPALAVKKIRSWHLDIIHSQTEMSMGIFARFLARQYGIPLVHTYHTMYKDYTYYVSKNLKYFDMGLKKAVAYFSKFYCDNTANAFIVPTIKIYKLFREEYHYDKDIYIVPTGIDVTPFLSKSINKKKVESLRKKLGYKKNDFVLIFAGRTAQEKNIEFLLSVMNKEKDKKIKLLIVGYGPDLEKYKELAHELDVEDKVKFTGRVEWTDMPYYYHLADASITASKTETQGLTVIEGMAAGLPALCMNDDAFRTMVVDGLNGMFFETESECLREIEDLASSKLKCESMSRQAVVTAKKFSPEDFAKSVLVVYDAAIENYNKTRKRDIPGLIVDLIKEKREKKNEKDDSTEPKE